MLLRHSFGDPQLNLTLERFLRMLREQLGRRLVAVLLYGSVLWDDLAPGYGDLDFLAVVEGDLSEADCAELVALRRPLRAGPLGCYAQMLEGAFLPRRMLDPEVAGSALWWGTTGERPWSRSRLGWLVLHVIRERGLLLWGEDVRHEIPPATREALLEDVRAACRSGKEHGRPGSLHSVDWLLTAARLLLWLREGRLSSKSEAADWGAAHAAGAWRAWLPQAKALRRHPSLAGTPETQAWLAGLAEPIAEAYAELDAELRSGDP